MDFGVVLALVAVSLATASADISVNDYIYWKKADINAWHEYFPSRALQEEYNTNLAAVEAATSLAAGLNLSLSGIVAFQAQELQTAQMIMSGSDAEGCVNGISDYMVKAIQEEVETYGDCASDALAKLARLNNTWATTRSSYLAAYSRAMSGIDACARTYPNKDAIDRLKSCVESMNTNYFRTANRTQAAMFPSPSMSYFQQTVVGCASSAAMSVAAKGAQFLKLLLDCAALNDDIDIGSYKDELAQWKGYNDTLADQISDAQNRNYYQVWAVETEMMSYYQLQKQALEKYVIESRGFAHYLTSMYRYLSSYYNTVTATSVDNPADSGCADVARQALDDVASAGAAESLCCDVRTVNDTKRLIREVNDNFLYLNKLMPTIGNAAVLQCFVQGYVFAPDTISSCFGLTYSGFDVTYTDNQTVIGQDMQVLSGYEASFFSGNDLPCGAASLKRVYLGAETALYRLQRCLYKQSGTVYSVTTPASYMTTPVTTTRTTNSYST